MRSRVEVALIAAYFWFRPLILAFAHTSGESATALHWRPVLIYGIAAPAIGTLFLVRHPRARFAGYIFLTMEIIRSAVVSNWLALGAAVCVLLYLQTPRMRRLYPSIVASEVLDRMRRKK